MTSFILKNKKRAKRRCEGRVKIKESWLRFKLLNLWLLAYSQTTFLSHIPFSLPGFSPECVGCAVCFWVASLSFSFLFKISLVKVVYHCYRGHHSFRKYFILKHSLICLSGQSNPIQTDSITMHVKLIGFLAMQQKHLTMKYRALWLLFQPLFSLFNLHLL